MTILAHRGFWNLHDSTPKIKLDSTRQNKLNLATKPNATAQFKPNSLESFANAFQNGFGIELDLRDFDSQIVISHDLPCANAIKLKQLFGLYNDFFDLANSAINPPLALNIKADGLQILLQKLLEKYRIKNYFCFDMSVPDMRYFAKSGLKFFTRQSEIEPNPALYDKANGVWCDEFYFHWISKRTILGHLAQNKQVAIVSPELHKREYKSVWREYRAILESNALQNNPNIFLCTDFPLLAETFFATTENPTTKDFLK